MRITKKINVMKNYLLSILWLIVCSVSLIAQPIVLDGGIKNYKAEERPWLWWFWLGNIVSEKLIDQHMKAYAQAGYGGVVIISTYGVSGYEEQQIDYRSPEWYKMIRYTLKKASQYNMKVDLALSSAWPFGGKQVTQENGAKYLKRSEHFWASGQVNKKIMAADEYVIAVSAFSARNEYMDLTDLVNKEGFLCASLPEGQWTIETVLGGFTNQMVKRSSPGGEGLVLDNFDKQALNLYLDDFEKDLKKMKGIRALFNDSYEVYGADYTSTFIEEFEKRRGYSPKPYFSLLLNNDNTEIAERFRCDYRATIAELILENFTIEWTRWSNERSFKTIEQAHGSPSNILDMYAAADIPQCESFGPSCFDIDGVRVDADTRRDPYKWPDILHMKFASSAGNLTGKPLVASETATWLTNHFHTALSQVKPEVDKLFVAGINHIHMISSTNTPLDTSYPGWVFYPAPDFGPRSSLIGYMPDFNLYAARIQRVLQQSKNDNDLLLYYPVFDYFSETKNDLGVLTMMDHIPTKWGNDWSFAVTANNLKNAGYQFDYVSDKLLKETEVLNGKVRTKGGHLYKAIVIPACKRIPIETMRKLQDLARQGVPVVFDRKMPGDVPGLYRVGERLQELFLVRSAMQALSNVIVADNVDTCLQSLLVPKTEFSQLGLDFIRKELNGGRSFFVANQKKAFSIGQILLDRLYQNVVAYNPLTGSLGKLEQSVRDGKTQIKLQLLPGESVILFADCGVRAEKSYDYFEGNSFVINSKWKIDFQRNELNPSSIETERLVSWTELGDSTHWYYNGVGIYSTVFDCPFNLVKNKSVRLNFADVRDMAEVYINGKFIGRIWSVPYQLSFDSNVLKQKGNKLEVRVQNIATNKIIGMDRQGIKWQECYISDPKRREYNTADWNLEPAGLIGNVYIEVEE